MHSIWVTKYHENVYILWMHFEGEVFAMLAHGLVVHTQTSTKSPLPGQPKGGNSY